MHISSLLKINIGPKQSCWLLLSLVCIASGIAKAAPDNAVPWQVSTFVGSDTHDSISDLAVAANGDVYVVGHGISAIFSDEKRRRKYDLQVFVARFSAQGRLLAHTVVGGNGEDGAQSIALDPQGRVIIAGYTQSRDWATRSLTPALPRVVQPRSSDDGNEYDVFIASFNADLTPRWTRRIGGGNDEFPGDLAVDGAGNAYLTGRSGSADFPIRNAPRYGRNGRAASSSHVATDAFLCRVTPAGVLAFSTLIGGKNYERGQSLALTRSGEIVVAGGTDSPDFPRTQTIAARADATAGADKFAGSGQGIWVSKLSGDGSKLLFSTLLGGSISDEVNALALGADDTIYLTGATSVTNFPVTPRNAAQPIHGAMENYAHNRKDAFVMRLRADGSIALFSTFLGGNNDDVGRALAVDANGGVWVAGTTISDDFPLQNAFARVAGGGGEGFIAHLHDGELLRSEFVGGDKTDAINAIALAPDGDSWIAGETASANFPVRQAWQAKLKLNTLFDDPSDGFLMRFSDAPLAPDVTPPQISIEEPRSGEKLNYLRPFAGSLSDDGSGVADVKATLEVVLSQTPNIGYYRNLVAGQRVYWNGYVWQTEPVEEESSRKWYGLRAANNSWAYNRPPTHRSSAGVRGGNVTNLVSGRYTLRVTATDRAGNSASATSTFTVETDELQPSVTFTSPAPGAQFRAWNVIGGRATDKGGSGIERVEVNIWRMPPNKKWSDLKDNYNSKDFSEIGDWNGKKWQNTYRAGPGGSNWLPATYADGRWLFNDVPRGADLQPGNYRIRVRAFDRAKNDSELWEKENDFGYELRETALNVRVLP